MQSNLQILIVCVPVVSGTICAPLVAGLFLFCYERDFMKSLSRENQADIIEPFNSTSRYRDDLLNIDNIYFDQMVDRIYPTELQLNRANSSSTEAPFCPPPFRRTAEGYCFWLSVVRGEWFRIFSRYLVPLTPPTVFVRSF